MLAKEVALSDNTLAQLQVRVVEKDIQEFTKHHKNDIVLEFLQAFLLSFLQEMERRAGYAPSVMSEAASDAMLAMVFEKQPDCAERAFVKIIGVILDANDARVVDATIKIDSGKVKREVKSGEEGEFEVWLPAGSYRITVEANGFRRFVYSPLKVKANVTEVINIHLEVAAYTQPFPYAVRLNASNDLGCGEGRPRLTRG